MYFVIGLRTEIISGAYTQLTSPKTTTIKAMKAFNVCQRNVSNSLLVKNSFSLFILLVIN